MLMGPGRYLCTSSWFQTVQMVKMKWALLVKHGSWTLQCRSHTQWYQADFKLFSQNEVSNTGEVRKLKAVCSNTGYTHTHTAVTKVRFLYRGLQQALILRCQLEDWANKSHINLQHKRERNHVVVVVRFYIVLFSALQQIHCACIWFCK